MSSWLQDSAIENIAKDKGQKFIQEAQADHLASEMQQGQPCWWSRLVSAPLGRLGGAFKAHGNSKNKRLPNARLRGHPRPSH